MSASQTAQRTVVLIPSFNDWEPLAILLKRLDEVMSQHRLNASVLVVDDASHSPAPAALGDSCYRSLLSVDVLRLRRNLGHQRAIACGLVYIFQRVPCDAVVVMDSDGEDLPEHVPLLLSEMADCSSERVIFAARSKRLESWVFRLFYRLYQFLHWVLTGRGVRFGNFSVIPARRLAGLVTVSEMWSHYAAAVIRARIPHGTIPLERGKRFAGRSQMSFVSLVVHGLSGISVSADVVGVRLLAIFGILALTVSSLIAMSAWLHLGTQGSAPGWAIYTTGILALTLIQTLISSLLIVFGILSVRSRFDVIPLRDCPLFVEEVKSIFSSARAAASVR